MASIPGLPADAYYGDAEKPLPDWRATARDDETDDDDITEDEARHVAALLAFDPAEADDEEDEG